MVPSLRNWGLIGKTCVYKTAPRQDESIDERKGN
jgi:hypothetical protein